MKINLYDLKIGYLEQDRKDAHENPKYKQLKNEFINIPIGLSGNNYIRMEIPPNAKEEELSGIFSIHNYGIYDKDYFKGQKLLIVIIHMK